MTDTTRPDESGHGEVRPSRDRRDPVRLEIFRQLFASVAEEMGTVLRRTAHSPNIKERRDFSCAVFDRDGGLVAQAAHIPVHLGAMPLSVRACVEGLHMGPGDVAILNDPYRGGTHLPDITMVTPVFMDGERLGFAASRAHHADVGGSRPGSMALSRELYQEGIVIPPTHLIRAGERNDSLWRTILANVRTPEERAGDLRAQLAANREGEKRLRELVDRHGAAPVRGYMDTLQEYAARMMRRMIQRIPDGEYRFADRLDDDGVSGDPVEIRVSVQILGDRATVDFSGSSPQREGGVNAVRAITLSATYYVFRSLADEDVPTNGGCLEPIELVAPEGTVVNARPPAAVAAGNVETSQRITDVLLGALAKACPDRVPAASQGTMNNVTVGGHDPHGDGPYAYYETIGGGMGARPGRHGASGIHTHMTNTLNTPAEALEYAYPLRVGRSELREGSGGAGRWRGGDGIRRDLVLLHPARVSLLSDRRRFSPYGLDGGEPGAPGRNLRRRPDGEWQELPGKCSVEMEAGEVLRVETPGGGGHGSPGAPAAEERMEDETG